MTNKQQLVIDMLAKAKRESDMDWVELAEKHNVGCTADHLRKMAQGLVLADEAGMLSSDGEEPTVIYDLPDEIVEKMDIVGRVLNCQPPIITEEAAVEVK